jgi:F-type H+-transporting ATPase subunit delta
MRGPGSTSDVVSGSPLAVLRGRLRGADVGISERWPVAQESSIVSGVAGRYATALFELARDEGVVDTVARDLAAFDQVAATQPDVERFVRSPVFSSEEQARALKPVLESLGIGGITANFLQLVTAKRRLFAIRDIVRAFSQLVDQSKGVVRAQVTLAETPSDRVLGEIRQALKDVAGEQVAVDVKIDPAIIGGIVVKVGSRMVDSSLRTKLNGIRTAMKEVG